MTVQELYDYCKKRGIADYTITKCQDENNNKDVTKVFVYLADKKIELV